MTCEEALPRLLEAELAELDGHGDSAIAVHLRGCARCARLAAVMVAETAMLTGVAPGAGESRRWTHRPLAWAGALAAAVLALAVLRPSRHAGELSRAAPKVFEAVAARLGENVGTRSAVPVAVRASRFADVAATTPVRFAASQTVEEAAPAGNAGRVSVTPPAGRSVAVLATRNPSITVVWMY